MTDLIYVQKKIEYMNNLAVFGTTTYFKVSSVAKFFKQLRGQFGPDYWTIQTSGNEVGADSIIKKMALDLGFKLKEFNPSYTGYKMFSAEPKSYYGKSFHISHLHDRFTKLLRSSDKIIIFSEDGEVNKELTIPLKINEKLKIPIIIIK